MVALDSANALIKRMITSEAAFFQTNYDVLDSEDVLKLWKEKLVMKTKVALQTG